MERRDAKYEVCRVCGKPLPPALADYAKRRSEQATCSTACEQADIVKRFGCCSQAVLAPCVCTYKFVCPAHGERHVGTHD